jgi:hypothetical protein
VGLRESFDLEGVRGIPCLWAILVEQTGFTPKMSLSLYSSFSTCRHSSGVHFFFKKKAGNKTGAKL